MSNTGTKTWKHVKLVHVTGQKPLCGRIDVPEVQPGKSLELVAHYPALEQQQLGDIRR